MVNALNHFILLTFLVFSWHCIATTQAWWFFGGDHKATHRNQQQTAKAQAYLSPVIFVPGDGGSQVEAKISKSDSPYVFCQKNADWYNIWLNLQQLVLPVVYCWVDNIKLYYDNITRTTHNTPGVELRFPGWGNSEVVEWIDPTHNKAGAYFKDIGNLLVDKLGYSRKQNIYGAPYDFRKAPNEQTKFFNNLKELVEMAYTNNGNMSVTFITHSMGSPMTLVFLQQQTTEWKRKYVKRQISLAGAWAGSVKAVKVFAMGDDLDSPYLSGKVLKAEQITNPSTAWLLPSPLFWKPNEVLVKTPNRDYTMAQMEQFFNDIDYRIGWEMRKDNIHFTYNFQAPNVELHCIYGDGLSTVAGLKYEKSNIIDTTPKLIMGKGDGTVNERSLAACKHWQGGYQSSNISTLALSGVDHMSILNHAKVLDYIWNVLNPIN